MNTDQVISHLRKAHGIEPGTVYDPDLHAEVPALCFGTVPPSNRLIGDGAPLNPEKDLDSKLLSQGGPQ